jgi:hypothetical protein
MSDAARLRRAGDLKGELVAFSQQPRYDRAASSFLAEYGNGLEDADERHWMLLWDCFVLEHRLANGRTVVEQFVEARPDLPEAEREMVLGWRDVVQGPFEVQRRDGPALLVESLVDDLTYRVRSNMGPAVFKKMACCGVAGGVSRLCPISRTTARSRWSCSGWLLGIPRRRVSCSGGC